MNPTVALGLCSRRLPPPGASGTEACAHLYAELLDLGAEVLPVFRETLPLRPSDEAFRVLERRFENDRLHIAAATIADVDVVVKRNFHHLARLDQISLFNAVDIEQGDKPLTID